MSNKSENKRKYWYSVNAVKRFHPNDDSVDVHSYILGAWEDKMMPASAMKYWGGHGQAFGFRKLTLKNIFKGRRKRAYVASYDVSFYCDTLVDATIVVDSLHHLTNDDGVTVKLTVYPNNEEE